MNGFEPREKASVEKQSDNGAFQSLQPPFAKSLCRLIWDKVQDAVKLTEDKYRMQTERLEAQLLVKKT